jgi:hypothetical protein
MNIEIENVGGNELLEFFQNNGLDNSNLTEAEMLEKYIENKSYLYPRICSVTQEGMEEGYVCQDNTYKYVSDLLVHLRELEWEDADGNLSTDIEDDEELLEFFFNQDYYYYTEWSEEDIDWSDDPIYLYNL